MSEKYDRATKLFILASVCKQNNVTPDSPAFVGLIIRVCTSKLSLSTDSAKGYAEDLRAAYCADAWNTIAPSQETVEESPSNSTSESCINNPTFPTLKTFNPKMPCDPVKHIAPKHEAQPDTNTPHNQALTLLNLAQHDQWNGAGRITLSQARYELNDKSLRLDDVLSLLRAELPAIEFETRPGNTIYVYFNGKNASKTKQPVIVQSMAPLMYAALTDNTTQIEELDEDSDIPEEE
jgi:hypothetical protein